MYHAEIAELVQFLSQRDAEKDARIGWLENEVKRLSLIVAANAAASGETAEDAEDNKDGTDAGADDRLPVAGAVQPVDCTNQPGGSKKLAPMDHQHQGLHSISSDNFKACVAPSPMGVGRALILGGRGIVFGEIPAADNDGDGIRDDAVAGPQGANPQPGAIQAICDPTFYISHFVNTWAQSKFGAPADDCIFIPPCTMDSSDSLFAAPDCDNVATVKTFKVDCNGHVTEFDHLFLAKPTVSITDAEEPAPGPCCLEVLAATAFFDCSIDTPSQKQWRLNLTKVQLPKLPDAEYIEGDGTGLTCEVGETQVVTNVEVIDDESCPPCGRKLRVTRKCLASSGGGCDGGVTATFKVLCCVKCDTGSILVYSRTLTFTDGCLTDAGTCSLDASGGDCP